VVVVNQMVVVVVVVVINVYSLHTNNNFTMLIT
jgi:hypothetical protein